MKDIRVDNEGSRESRELIYDKHVPQEAIAAAEAAFAYGAEKYAERNWERGINRQALIDSLKRHITDYENRMDFDDGPGGSHLPTICMIMASACMLSASHIRELGEDDRLIAPPDNSLSGKECSYWIKDVLETAEEERRQCEEST